MIYADWEIEACQIVTEGFCAGQVTAGVLTYGLSSYGYDARLGTEFKICKTPAEAQLDYDQHTPQSPRAPFVVDPKRFDPNLFKNATVNIGDPVTIPANSFALGTTIERFKIPRTTLAICVGKSTVARCGVIVNVTPLEPEWEGHVTVEISNTTPFPAVVYAGEGIMQVVFLKSDSIPCKHSYADKKGRYQNQVGVVLPTVPTAGLKSGLGVTSVTYLPGEPPAGGIPFKPPFTVNTNTGTITITAQTSPVVTDLPVIPKSLPVAFDPTTMKKIPISELAADAAKVITDAIQEKRAVYDDPEADFVKVSPALAAAADLEAQTPISAGIDPALGDPNEITPEFNACFMCGDGKGSIPVRVGAEEKSICLGCYPEFKATRHEPLSTGSDGPPTMAAASTFTEPPAA